MQSGTTGYFVGRDGIPTDVSYLVNMGRVSGQLETKIRELFPYVLGPGAAYSPLKTAHENLFMDVSSVLNTLKAAVVLHQDDVETLRQLKDVSINDGLYATYRSMFLGDWMTSAPFQETKTQRLAPSPNTFRKMSRELCELTSIFMQLCHKVNLYGYEPIQGLLKRHGDVNVLLIVDRAMRFYKILTTTSDTAFSHVPLTPILAIPPKRRIFSRPESF